MDKSWKFKVAIYLNNYLQNTLILLIYVLIHILKDIYLSTTIYYHVYKNIFYNGILVLFFMRKNLDYKYMKKLVYKFSIYSFYIFYIEFIFFNNLYRSILTYMGLGIYMMFPMCVFLFSFLLDGYKKKDLFYFVFLFLTIILYGNRSPILIVVTVVYFLSIKNLSKIKKIILILLSWIIIFNLKNIIYCLNMNLFFRKARIVRKLYDFYNNIGTGILSGRDNLYNKYIIEILENPVFGNNIKSELIVRGDYSHNILIDILHNNGIIFGILLIIILGVILFKNMKRETLFLSVFCVFCILFFSSFYLLNRFFYFLLILCFNIRRQKLNAKVFL